VDHIARGRPLARRPIGQGDADGAVRTAPGGAVDIRDAPRGDLARAAPLQAVAHVRGPRADDRQRDRQRQRRPDAVDLLLPEAGQVERRFAQGLGGGAAGGGHDAARLALLGDQRPAPEGGGQLGRALPGRAGADHDQIIGFCHLELSPCVARLMCREMLLALFGPAAAAIIVTASTDGRAGIRGLLGRLAIWRVGLRWYSGALGLPALLSLGAVGLSLVHGASADVRFSTLSPLTLILLRSPAYAGTIGACRMIAGTDDGPGQRTMSATTPSPVGFAKFPNPQ